MTVPVPLVAARLPSRRGGCVQLQRLGGSQRLNSGFEFCSLPDSEASRDSSHGETRVVPSAAWLAVVRLWNRLINQNFEFLIDL